MRLQQIFKPIQSAAPRHHEVEIAVAIEVDRARIQTDARRAALWHNIKAVKFPVGLVEFVTIQHLRIERAGVAELVRAVALAVHKFGDAVVVQIHPERAVADRPRVVDEVLFPRALSVFLRLLQPKNAVVVAHRVNQIGITVAIHVGDDHGNRRLAEFKLGVPDPLAFPAIDGRFEPAVGADDVAAAVAIDVAEPAAVARGGDGEVVTEPFRFGFRRGGQQLPPRGKIAAARQQVELAIAVDVVEPARLHGAGFGDQVFLPFTETGARMLDPKEGTAAPVDVDQVGPAVAVDVHLEVRVPVPVRWHAEFFDVADKVLFPPRRFVPEPAAHDVEVAIAIDVHHGARLERRVGVDGVEAERQVGRPERSGEGENERPDEREDF